VFVRTGRWALWAAKGPWSLSRKCSGPPRFLRALASRSGDRNTRFRRRERPAPLASRGRGATNPSTHSGRTRSAAV
jgi:hypothetical protein